MNSSMLGRRAWQVAAFLPLVAALPTCIYLFLLTGAAPFARGRPARVRRRWRFALLIPAHNEERVLGRLLESIATLDYPRSLFDVHVVADNCTDATANVARKHGASAYERFDTVQNGKGYALQWLLSRLADSGLDYDAYVFLDADSVISPNFLGAMAARLEGGSQVMQAYYGVLQLHGTPWEALREVSLALVHFLRPLAKSALGASAGLKGNGMCFQRSVIDRFGWPTAGLAEDVEYHLELVAAGLSVTFVPEAVVRAEMPASLPAAQSQNLRWERGRLATVGRQALPLLGSGLRHRNVAMIDAAAEQLVPPLSVIGFLVAGGFGAAMIGRVRAARFMAVGLAVGLGAHVAVGAALAGVPPRNYRLVAYLPKYMAWKVALYARALVHRHDRRWVRTPR